jgi:hypothetical protein
VTINRADYEADVCRRLSQAEHIPFKQVSIGDWRPQVAHCHVNVDTWVKANGGAVPVRGWVTYASFGELGVGLTAHSIVQNPDGELFDITPLESEWVRSGMRFIRHVGDDRAFFEEKERNLNITCPYRGGAD